tara:strand:- start:382 stop:603 length:222 start_codon:yes stop_codon:yes gene_type:complete
MTSVSNRQENKDTKTNGLLEDEIKPEGETKSRVNIDNLMAKLKKAERKDRNINIFVTCSLLSILAVVGFLITG